MLERTKSDVFLESILLIIVDVPKGNLKSQLKY